MKYLKLFEEHSKGHPGTDGLISNDFMLLFPGITFLVNRRRLHDLDMLYLDVTDKQDMISFITKRRSEEVDDEYDNNLRQEIRIGRFLNRLKLEPGVVEELVNKYKVNFKRKFDVLTFEMVEGEEVRKWYLCENYVEGGGQLNSSCMRFKKNQKLFDIYTENPDVCKLLILKLDESSEKILGRALVWTTNKGIYLDRPYCRFDDDIFLFYKYAEDKGWLYFDKNQGDRMYIDIKNHDFGEGIFNPYMDTFKKYFPESSKLANYNNIDWGYFNELNRHD